MKHITSYKKLILIMDEWKINNYYTFDGIIIKKTENKGDGVYTTKNFDYNVQITSFDCKYTCTEKPLKRILELYDKNSIEHKFCQDVLQLDNNLYVLPTKSIAFLVNHSCKPNTYWKKNNNNIFLYSLRDIDENEEITFDYSTLIFDEFIIECKEHNHNNMCRGFASNVILFSDEQKRKLIENIPLNFLDKQVLKNLEKNYNNMYSIDKLKLYFEGSDLYNLVKNNKNNFNVMFMNQIFFSDMISL